MLKWITTGSTTSANATFESGNLTNWSFAGLHDAVPAWKTPVISSSYSLHIRCSDKVWTGDNSCQVALNANSLAAGQTATLRFEARWLHGWPEALLRLNGNWLEATGGDARARTTSARPGMPNSHYMTNAGPAIYNVTHNPAAAGGQPGGGGDGARCMIPDGVQSLTLYYRLDPATNYTAVPMKDDGTGGDAVAGDGVFSATIPGQAANQIVAFYISATDSLGAATRFPGIAPDRQ